LGHRRIPAREIEFTLWATLYGGRPGHTRKEPPGGCGILIMRHPAPTDLIREIERLKMLG